MYRVLQRLLLHHLVATCAAHRSLILFPQSIPDANFIASHPKQIDVLPVDGIVFRGETFTMTTVSTTPLNASAVHEEMQLVAGVLKNVTELWVLVHVMPAGVLSRWALNAVAANFAVLGTACRDAHVTGILFDVEDYTHKAWHPSYACPAYCPQPCLPQPPNYSGPGCPDTCLEPCRSDAFDAGAGVMRALVWAWPSAQLLTSHGPWLSDNRTAPYMQKTMPGFDGGNNWAKDDPIVGSFDIGLLSALAGRLPRGPTADGSQRPLYLDGGECYMQSTDIDVARMRTWMKLNMSQSRLVPDWMRAQYSGMLTVSIGVYDFPKVYHGKGPGTPAMWENDLAVSLRGMDPNGVTWAYSEAFDWVGLGPRTLKPPVPAEWLAATARARRVAN